MIEKNSFENNDEIFETPYDIIEKIQNILEKFEDKEIVAQIISDYCRGNVEYYREVNPNQEPAVDIEHLLFDKGSMKTANMITGRSLELMGGGVAWFRDNVLWTSFGIKQKMPARTFVETNRAPSQKAFEDLWNGKPTVEE